MHLQSKHIYLRAVEPSDATRIFTWENDEKYWHVSGTEIPFSLHTIQNYIDQAQDFRKTGQLRLIICLTDTNEAIGCVDLFEADFKNRRAGVGILIADEESKQNGYAFESLQLLLPYAQQVFDFRQLFCHISVSNTASIKLFEKVGFTLSGELKQWLKNGSVYEDVRIYQLLF